MTVWWSLLLLVAVHPRGWPISPPSLPYSVRGTYHFATRSAVSLLLSSAAFIVSSVGTFLGSFLCYPPPPPLAPHHSYHLCYAEFFAVPCLIALGRLASSLSLCHEVYELLPSRSTPAFHGIPSSFAAVVLSTLSAPNI